MLDPLTVERMEKAAGEGPILLGLSGGGDSVALLHLLVERVGDARLRAAVVDHALRPGSAEDAVRAQGLAQARGVRADVLTLAWPDGPKRAQAAARDMRYRALCEAARRGGARVIAVAHTADDQAETVLMRAAGGSAWRGLGGMAPLAPAPIWPEGRGIALARPLLSARRSDLRAFLRGRRAAWIEDPANTNLVFERVRVRARLAALEEEGLDPLSFTALADHLRVHAEVADRAARALIDRAAAFEDDRISIDLSAWNAAQDVRRRALSVLIAAAAGAQREPPADAIERLDLGAAEFRAATLGGAHLTRTGQRISITRDRGALAGRADGAAPVAPLALPQGREVVWDGRVALTAAESGWSVIFEAGAPVLAKGEARAPLAAAAPRWLLAERVNHLLPV
jgi:tRNA(Ile)-lysidine synthase